MKKLYTLFAVALAAVAMTSCFEDPGNETFFDGNQVEFADAKLPNGLAATFVRASETQTDQTEIGLNRVSTSAANAISVNIEVDPTSTAVEGVHYTLSGNSATIASGEFVGTFPVTVLTGNIDPSESPDLILNITSATGADIAANYGSITIRIRVICPSDLAGTWVFENGNVTTIEEIGTGNYVIANLNAMGGYYNQSFTLAGNFTDNCDKLELYGSEPTNGVKWRGSGVFDPATQTITWESVTDIEYNPDYSVTSIVMTRQ
ncbi:hypothetical protein AAGF08_08915 [Algoriphagus sp. SE2]|uniref:hypothetical protein n=1 Tax=Algoriphagus sp. SE2 TaxID=3141536 RepID=UPI0031CD062B